MKRKERKQEDIKSFKRLLGYLKPHRREFIVSIILMTFVVIVELVPPLFMAKVLELLKNSNAVGTMNKILLYLGVFILSLVVSIIIHYKQTILLQEIGQKIVFRIRLEVFEHIEKLSIDQLNKEPVGKLVTRVMNDPDSISEMFTSIVINLIRSIIMMIIILIILFFISIKLTLITLIIMPIILIVSYVFRKISRKSYQKIRNEISALNAFLSENLSGMKITQIFNQEDVKREEFRIRSYELERGFQKEILIYAIFRPLIYLITMAGNIAILYFGGLQVIYMILSYAILYAFNDLVDRFFNPIQQIAEEFNNLQNAYSSADKIFGILDLEPTIKELDDAIELKEFSGHVEFKNVWFYYLEDEWVLKDVSFEVKPGETFAFVGSTGSGKTTILSLIVRNYEIQKGEILIDGININKITRDSLRRHIGQMLQDVFLFNESILYNISLGNQEITRNEVIEAANYTGANTFIDRLPDRYDHLVLERGNNFSSGQRQLISFARAIVYKPSLLILDEATANIDSESEEIIQASLNKIMSSQTMLIVAHRLSTIQHSDKIVVLNKGEIMEMGNHNELLNKKGWYYNLYMIQFKEDKEGKNNE
ncbi:ABC transporter ATP-binding protein [Haploplasma modicum]|uniref:ABC transporter ATP-binding protein n=1 Tax=Haploplasma modicum TaxID=2150 RepID=UPI00214C2630|nr:ABC transporter ATP-binding protein [Haploplasma modicum]MCR1809042.1 ABC transporter ATP-binding protein/permease [Haploplasma modicum]